MSGDVDPAGSGPDEDGSASGGPDEGGSARGGPDEGGSASGGSDEGRPAEGDTGEQGPDSGGPDDSGPAEGAGHERGPADGGSPGGNAGGEDSGASARRRRRRGFGWRRGGRGGLATGGAADDRAGDAEAPPAGGGGGSAGGRPAAATGPNGPTDPGELLGEVRAIRRRTRLARHAYWFPLVLFGLLICASVPFYIREFPRGQFTYSPLPGPAFLQSGYLGGIGPTSYRGAAYYWLGAMLLGIAATVLWYRWRGNRVGLRTPARGYLITGVIIVALALLIPLADPGGGPMPLLPGDLLIRGTFALVLIGLGLCFLAWAERSAGLGVFAVVYLAVALVASLYDIQNVFFNWFGLSLGPTVSALPNVLLPALVLLLAGAGAWVVQRRYRPPAEPESAEG